MASGSGQDFNPKCTSADSLQETLIAATLTIELSDGTLVTSAPLATKPIPEGTIYGNFKLLSDEPEFAPSGRLYGSATHAFSQIWQELSTGLYLSNILTDGNSYSTATWATGDDMCRRLLNSGDGTNKWRLPTIQELCGSDASEGTTCKGGFYASGVYGVKFAGIDLEPGYPIWSSTSSAAYPGEYLILNKNYAAHTGTFAGGMATVCVR